MIAPALPSGAMRALFVVATGVVLAAVGALVATNPLYAIGLSGAVVLGALGRTNWTMALFLVGCWPLLYFGEGRAGIAFVLVGVLLCIQLIRDRVASQLRTAWGERTTAYIVLPVLLVSYVILISYPWDRSNQERIVIGVVACLPMYFAGAANRNRSLFRWILLLGVPLAILQVLVPSSPPFRNPILTGNTMWVVAGCALLEKGLSRSLKALIVLVCGLSMLQLAALGPIVAVIAAGGFAVIQSLLGASNRHVKPILRAIGVVVLVGTSLFLSVLAFEKYESDVLEPRFELNNVRQRQTVYSVAAGKLTIAGHGLGPISADLPGRQFELESAHNFFLDAAYVAGVIGILVPLILVGSGVLLSLRTRAPYAPLFVGLIVAQCFSGGIFESPATWFAMGALLVGSAPPDDQIRGRGPTNDAAETYLRATRQRAGAGRLERL